MKTNKLLLLAIVAVAFGALAWWSAQSRRAAPPAVLGRALLPNLDPDAVARIEITRAGGPVTLVRRDDAWTVTNLFGYPADPSKLGASLLQLHDLKVGAVPRDMDLGTNDLSLVDLQNAAGKPLATLRLGRHYGRGGEAPGRSGDGRYLCVAGDPQVYLVKESLDAFDTDAKGWVDSQLLGLQAADIQTIEISSPTGQVATFSRESGTLQMQGLATNEEFEASKSYGLESAFAYLSFVGIADPKLTDVQTGLATPGFFRVRLKNGDQYTARIGGFATNTTDRFVRLGAELAPPGTNAAQKGEWERRKADLDQKFGKWTYLVSSYAAENLTRTRADLVKPRVVATNDVPAAATANAPAVP